MLFTPCNDKFAGDDSIPGSGLCPSQDGAASPACLATADLAGATSFWSRAAQIGFIGPDALRSGILEATPEEGVALADLPECGV